MVEHHCYHCNGPVETKDVKCPNCGIPLPPNLEKKRQHNFILWFVFLVIFCFFMMIWLPPNWT
ncbi:hypothetical protein CDW43_15155 [Methylophaga nitratireducenticrescens]|nr:hypothetical protein CDW43_15155 [Methylophaga nitratireducenticrescens]